MKNKEQLAKEYASRQQRQLTAYNSFITGYEVAIENMKEYLFNTENHQGKESEYYISEKYLKQTIKFLNEK